MSKLNPISEERKKERKDAVIKELKSFIFPTVLLAIIAGLLVFVLKYQASTLEDEKIQPKAYSGDGAPCVLENEYLKFEMDSTSTNFTVTVKSSGKVWSSVPEGGLEDSSAINEIKKRLHASFILDYGTEAGLDVALDSWAYSAESGVYEIEQGEDYVRVDYSLGKISKEYLFPQAIRVDDLQELASRLDKNKSESMKNVYKKYDINKLGKKDNKEELLELYPELANEPLYILRSPEEMRDSVKKNLQKLFEEAGYTYEQFQEDKKLSNLELESTNPVFSASVIYKLDGDDLIVTVPMSSFEGPESYPIYYVSPLPYFGAGGADDEGYILLPEGGGSIINFNNGKTAQSDYAANIYGWDMALERKDVVHSTHANMNVYGIASGDDSFICILEDGASYATIKAEVGGKTSSYNSVRAEYSIRPREKFDLGSNANQDVYTYLTEIPVEENIVQRFSFIDSNDYVDMAKDYQNYLKDKYGQHFTKNSDYESTPVAVTVVGAIDKVKQILGIPTRRPVALTTYEEAEGIVNQLATEDNIGNLSIKYTGWCNGGVNQKWLNDIDTIGSLGNKKELKALADTAKELGVDFYLDGVTDYAYDSDIFDGFFSYTDAAKFLSRRRAELYVYSDVTFTAREGVDSYFLLHGDKIEEMANNLIDYAKEVNANISFQNFGKDLSSDYYRKDYYSREKQLNVQKKLLETVDDSEQKIMINSGNAYAVPYADFVTNMDLKGSEYTIIDETVPFYQIAIHGYVDYTGYPINVCGNPVDEVLYSVEYGAGLSFTLMKESSFTLQKTLYTEYYGSDIDEWHDEMLSIYTRYNNELGHTFSQEIVDHECLNADVSVTVYEDGTKAYVNYGYYDYDVDGVTVPARDYLVVR